jgi:hypothetical protein
MPNRALPADTTLEAMRVQMGIWQRLGPAGRQRLAFEMSERVRQIAREGIRRRHPEYTDDQVRLAEIRVRLGRELFQQVYPSAPRVLTGPKRKRPTACAVGRL